MIKQMVWLILWSGAVGLAGISAQSEIPDEITQAYQQGIELMTANQYQQALPLIFECQRTDPKNADYLNRLGYCYYKLGNYRDAKYAFAALLEVDSLNISAYSNLAIIAEQELNYNKAKSNYSRLIQIDSTNSYYYRQNALLTKKTGNIVGATALFHKAHVLNENDISTICELATGYLELKSLDYAQTIINKGLEKDSQNIRVLLTNARIRNALDDYPGVINSLEKTMALGDSSNYYAMMLSVAYLKVDSLDRCIDLLEKVIQRKKDGEHTHHYLGLAYELKDSLTKATFHFEKAIELGISAKVPRYHLDLAELYERSNKYYKAYHHYKKSFEYKADDEILFHIAHNSDRYYKDKKIALRYYNQYLKTSNEKYREYSKQRILQLKEANHLRNYSN